jgi:hypothetical protein
MHLLILYQTKEVEITAGPRLNQRKLQSAIYNRFFVLCQNKKQLETSLEATR